MKSLLHISFCFALLFTMADARAQSQAKNLNKADTAGKAVSPAPVAKPRLVVSKRPKPIRTELSGGLRLSTDGWSVFIDKGYVRSEEKYSDQFYNIRLFQIEFSEKKHPQQIKRTNTLGSYSNDKPRPFVYGKVNNFYAFKLGYGGRKMLAGKPEQNNVSMHWVYVGGLSVGLLKPYYLDAYVLQDNQGTFVQESIKYSDSTKSTFLSKPNIIGSSGFSKGIGEVKIVPGIHIKTALHFDFSTTKQGKVAVETGFTAEYYAGKVDIMANKEAKPVFFNVYAAIQFGKRW